MELGKDKMLLIHHFVDGTLEGQELKLFRDYFDSDESFAAVAKEHLLAEAALLAIQEEISEKQETTDNVKYFKNRTTLKSVLYASVAAMLIGIVLTLSYKLTQLQQRPLPVIVETDTLYLPKNEYFKLPKAIAPNYYAQNFNMDSLVELTNITTRDDVYKVKCLPKNDMRYSVGEEVSFLLPAFKPDTYGFTLLAFHEHITAIDTICKKEIKLIAPKLPIYQWKPQTRGIYYWMIHVKNNTEPYVVRRIRVK